MEPVAEVVRRINDKSDKEVEKLKAVAIMISPRMLAKLSTTKIGFVGIWLAGGKMVCKKCGGTGRIERATQR